MWVCKECKGDNITQTGWFDPNDQHKTNCGLFFRIEGVDSWKNYCEDCKREGIELVREKE
jgi:hypothetical protein